MNLKKIGRLEIEKLYMDSDLNGEEKMLLIYLSHLAKTSDKVDTGELQNGSKVNVMETLFKMQLKGYIKVINGNVVLSFKEPEPVIDEEKEKRVREIKEKALIEAEKAKRERQQMIYHVDRFGSVEVLKPAEEKMQEKKMDEMNLYEKAVHLFNTTNLKPREVAEYLNANKATINAYKVKAKKDGLLAN